MPADVAFDFLVDPRNRPLWQSSLRRVEAVSPDTPTVGQTWTDVTTPGLRPRMRTTRLDRAHAWTEVGTWRSVTAELTLLFEDRPGGCLVTARFELRGGGPARLPVALLARVAPYAVRADLRRAARILSERAADK